MQVDPTDVGCDVTLRQHEKYKSNGIFSAAVRSKKIGQPNGPKYTSTPKTSHPKLEHYVGVAEPTKKGQVGVVTALDPLIKKVALLFGILIIGYKSVILTMPYITGDSIQVLSHQVQSRWNETLVWATRHQLGSRLSPLLCGLLVAAFAYGIVYLDSAVPGVNPPSPFSPRSKKRFREEKTASLHLGYLCALFCGFLVTVFMYFDLYS
ncbi:ADP-ribosylation factor-like protein 6-interacting protein 6 [Drosophila teissieri]|uniref:ADP-ribosylation factor-like protein 6-interacting protein 6 n=1 Tax=Drosophila teissieri TaxID=7243 RepID=UPI001CB9DDD2|nr:ADP-ribosylation factor-like protein 6-interacting protein 6 [Drosophila teissieri]